jgi:hypothetical protein
MRGANDIVKFLAEHGANLDVKNKQGLTPLDIAEGKVVGPGQSPRPPKESTVALLSQLIAAQPKHIETAQAPAPDPAPPAPEQ